LRSPLTAIKMNLDLLASSKTIPKAAQHRFASNAQFAADKMMGLINDMLMLAQLEESQLALSTAPIDLFALLSQCTLPFQINAQRYNISLSTEICPDLPPVYADHTMLVRVLDNLISNALHHTPRKGRVTVSAELKNKMVRVSVKDSGHGIPADQLDAIFEKFAQIYDPEQQRTNRGTGLGLTFCKLAVEAHGGRIWATSALGSGSDFIFTLPIMDSAETHLPQQIADSKPAPKALKHAFSR
ncbi:MAG: HAMP domain-containing histidine kinase, partial [Methylococcales bacterium]|nr:HAMP domain-containing histidine kinase [Methylococcales bacterium]